MTQPSYNTPIAIIQDAYFDAGLIAEGQQVNSEQITNGMRRLTDIIRLWQTGGCKLWLNTDQPITLVSGQSTYTLGPGGDVNMTKPMRVIDAWYTDSSGVRRPLIPLGWTDYVRLSQVNQTGQLNSYFVRKDIPLLSVFFWNTPDSVAATGVAHLQLQVAVGTFTNLTDTMDFPDEWRIALRWGLADELATGQPQAIMDRCQQRATTYRTVLEDWDVEDAPTRFALDNMGQAYMTGKFV